MNHFWFGIKRAASKDDLGFIKLGARCGEGRIEEAIHLRIN